MISYRSNHYILIRLYEHWDFSTTRRLKDLHQLLYSAFQDVWRTHINLCNDDQHWNTKRESKTEMLFCHSNDTSVSSNLVFSLSVTSTMHQSLQISAHHQHDKIRRTASHAKHSGLQVLFMTSEVYETDDLGCLTADIFPSQLSSSVAWMRYRYRLGIKAKDFHSYAGCSS